MHHKTAVAVLVLSLSLVSGGDLLAQRSGFIFGFGVGAGSTTYVYSFRDFTQTSVGLATDLKIGGQVGESFQIYYLGRTNWFSDNTLIAAGISALGVTYVLPSASLHLSAGLGLASWIEICIECYSGSFSGLGLTGGLGWEFADLFLLDFAVTYGKLGNSTLATNGEVDMFLARAGISILSH